MLSYEEYFWLFSFYITYLCSLHPWFCPIPMTKVTSLSHRWQQFAVLYFSFCFHLSFVFTFFPMIIFVCLFYAFFAFYSLLSVFDFLLVSFFASLVCSFFCFFCSVCFYLGIISLLSSLLFSLSFFFSFSSWMWVCEFHFMFLSV